MHRLFFLLTLMGAATLGACDDADDAARCPDLTPGLPRNHLECVQAGGQVSGSAGAKTCLKYWSERTDAEGYAACTASGGGQVEEEPGKGCKINYPESGCPCLSNACD